MSAKKFRCAIYTRKSSDEGLDQNFNSLDAQREACGAYILSQAGEGWSGLKETYEDGGYSGGTMERPGLQRLLQDIKAGRIDVVVVYKVDRLTRSLTDFAKIVDYLDKAGASFVSITQAFNTTTSMGRLTLNVLLSFAQFEREVTSERIRDKIAASKAKGMWMGGMPPIGYDVRDRLLVVNEAEAETVRYIFKRYLEVRSVHALCSALKAEGVRSKKWTTAGGVARGGNVMTNGALHCLLKNRIYLGDIVHRKISHRGQHTAILDQELFDQVQRKLASNAPAIPGTKRRSKAHKLLGLLFDDRDNVMTSAHGNKRGRRYLYYVSMASKEQRFGEAGSLARIAAPLIEDAVLKIVAPLLKRDWRTELEPMPRAISALQRVVISSDAIVIDFKSEAAGPIADATAQTIDANIIRITRSLQLRRRSSAQILSIDGSVLNASPRVDQALVRGLVLARKWAQMLEAGEPSSIEALAKHEHLCVRNTGRMLPLAYLAPDLVETILAGRQPASLNLTKLVDAGVPFSWSDQRALFAQFA